eukprot:CAMPEP_0206588432 /NCGR_PEP_ID=MMETSP0325_2-20121206/38279_1 /ASSEMBLY_ACC=CAM_ASM_000347 /TAXON_ID=2866 /ORGANISM="Crypthecodinium cohnii, Strain Seligo" /LENGTH=781 /DNA_ID=CAMNT_0054096709 /DNA_START=40 /DNA_END=2386 /DNA_ORIENTATION=-
MSARDGNDGKSQSQSTAPPRDRRANDEVVLKNLQARPELNGTAGRIENWDSSSGRYVVALENGQSLKVQDQNLGARRKLLVSVVCGAAGSGRREVVRHILKRAQEAKVRVGYLADHSCIEDGEVLPVPEEAISRLDVGCCSSTRRLDFTVETLRLADAGYLQHLLVEGCPEVEPKLLLELWHDELGEGPRKGTRRSLPERLRASTVLQSLVVTVDGLGLLRRLATSSSNADTAGQSNNASGVEEEEDQQQKAEEEELQHLIQQLEYADTIVATGAEQMGNHEVQTFQELYGCFENAQLLLARGTQVPMAAVFGDEEDMQAAPLIGEVGPAGQPLAALCRRACCAPKGQAPPPPAAATAAAAAAAASIAAPTTSDGAASPGKGPPPLAPRPLARKRTGGKGAAAASRSSSSSSAASARIDDEDQKEALSPPPPLPAAAQFDDGYPASSSSAQPQPLLKQGGQTTSASSSASVFTYCPDRPFHPVLLGDLLAKRRKLPAELQRASGTAWVASRPLQRGVWSTVENGETTIRAGPEWWATVPKQHWPETASRSLLELGLILAPDSRWAAPDRADCHTLLEVVCDRGSEESVKASLDELLVESGSGSLKDWATMEEGDFPPWTERPSNDALSCLALTGLEDTIEALLARRADPDARNNFNGGTALHAAALKGRERSVKALLEHRATANVAAARKLQPIHLAATGPIVDLLATAGSNLEAEDETGHTSLHHAASLGKHQVVAALLEHRAEVDVRTVEGDTALSLAEAAGHDEISRLLRAAGASQTG